jgi:GNAT superfamily N-acetyltransferase
MRFVGLVPIRPTRRPRSSAPPAASQQEGITPALLAGCDAAAPPPASASSTAAGGLQPPPLTRSDAAFAADGLEFVWGPDGLDLGDLNDLFEKVGFPRRDPARLGAALAHSHAVLWVRATKGGRWARAGQLLGFARTTSDGALAATVWDVAVSPAWQRGGLGRALVERLTARVVGQERMPAVTLYAEPGVVGWYERCGFAADPGGAKGMAFQRTSEAGKALVERALKRGGGGGGGGGGAAAA